MVMVAIPQPAAKSLIAAVPRPQPPLTSTELVQLARAMQTLMGVAEALTLRPGFLRPDGHETNAGKRFDQIAQAISDEYLEVMSELRESAPRGEREAEDRSCELLAFDLNCDDDTTGTALAAVRSAFPGRY